MRMNFRPNFRSTNGFQRASEEDWKLRRNEEVQSVVTRSCLDTDFTGASRALCFVDTGSDESIEDTVDEVVERIEVKGENLANREEKKLKDMTKHNDEDGTYPIQVDARVPFIEIKNGLLNILPKFYGLLDEDLFSFLNEFVKLCKIQKRPTRVTDDNFKLTSFPFAMTAVADAWFKSLPAGSVEGDEGNRGNLGS